MKLDFVEVISPKELLSGKMLGIEVKGVPILLVNLDGQIYALGNKCTHRGCILSEGELKGDNVQCRCHRSVFDVKTGKVVKGPAKNPALVYQTSIEAGYVSIST